MNQQPAFNGLEIATPVLSAGGSQVKSLKALKLLPGVNLKPKPDSISF